MTEGKRRTLSEEHTTYQKRKKTANYEMHPLSERLIDWFGKSGGWLNPDVHIVYNDSNGFHIRATRPLSSPDLVTCPLNLTLSYLNLDHSQNLVRQIDSPLQKFLGVLPNHVLSLLLLIEQRYLASKGKGQWEPYIACLPEPGAMTSSLWFDDDDMECLTGTNLAAATRDRRNSLASEWENAVQVVRGADLPIPDLLKLENYYWAATISSSRSFTSAQILPDIEPFPILFPVLDILNHSLYAKIEWIPRPSKDFTLRRLDHEAVRPGEEIFNNYFPKQNAEWLLAYGFCIPDNPVEHFAIKMTVPPHIEEELENRFLLYEPSHVPFGMSTAFLADKPNQEQHYLRTPGHPFGRYANNVPFLQGIPPWIVHLHFVMTLQTFEIKTDDIKIAYPPGRIVLEVLLRVYEAVKMKSQSLQAFSKSNVGINAKQKYATIYRDGQVRIINAIRHELEMVITKLQSVDNLKSPNSPIIISTTQALTELESSDSSRLSSFKRGLLRTWNIEFSDWEDYGAQIASLQEDDGPPVELSVWKFILFIFVYHSLTDPSTSKLIHRWVHTLLQTHPLPAVEDAIRSPDDNAYGYFMADPRYPVLALNDLTSRLREEPLRTSLPMLQLSTEQSGVEKLGWRVRMWAEQVVHMYAFQLDIGGQERICMYMSPWREEGEENEWAYEDIGS